MGVDIMSVNNPLIPGLIQPVVPSSVPFTYRDGLTVLQLIECIKHNLDELQAFANSTVDNVNKALSDQTAQNQDTLTKAQKAAQDAAHAVTKAQEALDQYQNIVDTVNTSEEDIAAINANLNALHANSVENATSLYKKITDTEFTELIVIGDSYAQGIGASDAAHRYANIVANALGLNLHNYGIGGTGFNNQGSAGNGRFDNQINIAINDDSYPHNKVKYIIVEGGTNDWGDMDTARTVTQIICEKAKENFPNARILFVLTQGVGPGSIGLYPANKIINYPAIQETASKYDNADVLRGDFWFNIWNATDFSSGDMIHPNDNGHQFIASRIICALRYGDFSKIENLRSSYSQNYITINEKYADNISEFTSIIYFIGNGLCNLTINFRYTVQADEIDPSGTYYRINKALLNFPDNVQIKYPNISPLEYTVSKGGANAFTSKHMTAYLFDKFNSPLKFAPGAISGLPQGTAQTGDKLAFSVHCVFPYLGYSN